MVLIKRSLLKRLAAAAMIALAVGAIVAGGVLAETGVTLQTAPSHRDVQVYRDVNANGQNEADELVGEFDLYNGNSAIVFSWDAYPFESGANGSYRVSLWQNTAQPGSAAQWGEVVVAHHWATNPNGPVFSMGPFNRNYVCTTCPSKFVVQPETYVKVYNAASKSYEYQYTVLPAASGQPAALTESPQFVIDIFYVAPPSGGSAACDALTDDFCLVHWCGGDPACVPSCLAMFYVQDDAACGCSVTAADCALPGDYNASACGCW